MAFNGIVLTTKGQVLQSKVQAGAALSFTKIKLGDGQLAQGAALEALNDLINPLLVVPIENITAPGDGTAVLTGTLTNTGLTAGFFVREIGVFATDPTAGEILYAVGNAGSQCDYLPAGGGATAVEHVLNVITAIGNAASVTAVIDEATVFATKKEVTDHANRTDNPHQVTASQVGALATAEAVTVATANKILRLDLNGKFPSNILGVATPFSGDFNAVMTTGFYLSQSGTQTNSPTSASNFYLIVIQHSLANYAAQIAVAVANNTMYYRTIINGTWGPWYKLSANLQMIGGICYFPLTSAPTGWLKANGAAVSRTTYSDLFSVIGTTFGAGDGSTTFNLPDLRGEFIRGYDDGRGVDSGRALGSEQLDAFQGHWHEVWSYGTMTTSSGGSTSDIRNSANTTLTSTNGVRNPISDGVNGTPRTAAETRPRNIALLACIKY